MFTINIRFECNPNLGKLVLSDNFEIEPTFSNYGDIASVPLSSLGTFTSGTPNVYELTVWT